MRRGASEFVPVAIISGLNSSLWSPYLSSWLDEPICRLSPSWTKILWAVVRGPLFQMNSKLMTITVLMAMLLGSCSSQSDHLDSPGSSSRGTAGASSAGRKEVTIAQFGHVFLYMPLYVAIRKGFFEKHGLAVKLVSTGGDEKTFTAVATGNAQFGVSDPTFVAIAREHGKGGKVVAAVVRGVPFWVVTLKPESEIGRFTSPHNTDRQVGPIFQAARFCRQR